MDINVIVLALSVMNLILLTVLSVVQNTINNERKALYEALARRLRDSERRPRPGRGPYSVGGDEEDQGGPER
jgi:hypothetical protein